MSRTRTITTNGHHVETRSSFGAASHQAMWRSAPKSLGGGVGGSSVRAGARHDWRIGRRSENSILIEICGGSGRIAKASDIRPHPFPWQSWAKRPMTSITLGGLLFALASCLSTGSDFVALARRGLEPDCCFACLIAQHGFTARIVFCFSRSAAAVTSTGTETAFCLAQATFCAFVKQQQLFQHFSALRQPHGRFWHGKGWELSFSREERETKENGTIEVSTATRRARAVKPRRHRYPLLKSRETINLIHIH